MHNTAGRYYGEAVEYHAIKLEPDELASFAALLNNENLKGVNITIPYKEVMKDYVDEVSPSGRQIGAINTIQKKRGKLVGHNTDADGFLKPLDEFEGEIYNSRAIIFGTGGASKAIVYALQQLQVQEIILVSRNPQNKPLPSSWNNVQVCSYDAWPSFVDEARLVVNATPLGMDPRTDTSPIHAEQNALLEDTICYDIVYRPRQTKFLRLAEKAGARTIGGLEMLIHQGSQSFKLWTGHPFPIDIIRVTLDKYLKDVD